MASFLGRYEYQLDPKGRVSLPADFRRQADGSRFVLLQWEKPWLALYTEDRWEVIQARVLKGRRANPEMANHFRSITSTAVHVEPDKQGRILVPSWLKGGAELEGTVLMIGNVDRIELWNPETFERTISAAKPTEAELSALSHEIFG